MEMIELICAYSGEKFLKRRKEYNSKLKKGQVIFYKNRENGFLARKEKLKIKTCSKCGKVFLNKNKKFCSRICFGIGKPKIKKLRVKKINNRFCRRCNKEFFLKGRQSSKYCSVECRKEILSISGRKSVVLQAETRRSLNEKYFFDLCFKKFSNVENNKQIFNGWDADIIIHDLKVAILWNGKWHYQKIKKDHSVKQVQNRDKIKQEEIIKFGYKCYIIKDMGKYNRKFVEKEFQKFLVSYAELV